jgi:hypothetical protein
MCMKAHGKVFGVWSREETINEEILSGTPSSKCFTHVQKDFGENERAKIANMELNWLYSALIARQPIDPTHLMINRWCCEATSSLGDIGSGCYLSMFAISLRPGITRNLNHLLPGTSRDWIYEARQEYKWRWERRLQSGQSKFAPIRWKISWGERGLVRGRTSCAGEGNKREGL